MEDSGRIGRLDEAGDVHIDKGGHQVLAVEAIDNTAVAGNNVAKVLDLEGPLEATGKEAAKGANDGAEERQRKRMQDKGIRVDGLR